MSLASLRLDTWGSFTDAQAVLHARPLFSNHLHDIKWLSLSVRENARTGFGIHDRNALDRGAGN